MFTIDLLKGEGIPIKSGPEGIAVAVITFAVPVIIAILMFGSYMSSSADLSIQKQEIIRHERKIRELSDAVEMQKSFEKEKTIITSCLSEVASSIGRHTQWSPVLATLARNMPDSIVLNRLEVRKKSVKRSVPKKDDPEKMVDISVPVTTLRMNVSGDPRYDCDRAVRNFRNRLRLSTVLGPKLEHIRVSQESDTIEGQDVVSYEIDCIFKPEL